ncbi:hypothetical protein NDU88_007389 [Pleurodeles waltl]|uniref:Uncharacterized protein n=1 Tax=Pleurodeles waltl TaxID=8319 RepID=A0AAV7UPR5_PLEWA|nr:hypothetical protein NDU88_007389 [Pleurodeles waltl]
MGKDRPQRQVQDNTIVQYTTPCQATHRITRHGPWGTPVPSPERQEKQSRAALMQAVQGSRVALERQIAGISVEINLFHADLCKVVDKRSEDALVVAGYGVHTPGCPLSEVEPFHSRSKQHGFRKHRAQSGLQSVEAGLDHVVIRDDSTLEATATELQNELESRVEGSPKGDE